MTHETRAAPFIIGVAGGTGSGKTTVSNRIRAMVGAEHLAYIQHDSYYYDMSHLPPAERAKQNYDHPESLDTPLLVQQLHQLRRGEPVAVPVYDFATHSRRAETQRVHPARIVLVEGILIFWEKALRDLMDMRIFVDTAADLRFIRRLHRDTTERGRTLESVIDQYLATVRPMHLEFVEPSKRHADLLVPEGGYNRVAVELVVTKLRNLLARRGWQA